MKLMIIGLLGVILICPQCKSTLRKRSIDLIAAHSLISDGRLPREVIPNRYKLDIQPFLDKGTFAGQVKINITWVETTDVITLHADASLEISETIVTQLTSDDETEKISSTPMPATPVAVKEVTKMSKKPLLVIQLAQKFGRGSQAQVTIKYRGLLFNDTSEGLFRHSYVEPNSNKASWYVASHLRPNLARRVFPCFDEPAYKVPFDISIGRQEGMVAMSNTPLISTSMMKDPTWVWDHFEETPPMSTFTVGIVVANFSFYTYDTTEEDGLKCSLQIRIWGRPEYLASLEGASSKIVKSLAILEDLFASEYPFPKLDCLALPNYQATRPADNWGLILFKESELGSKNTWHIAQELVYQWLGASATPYWWSDAHVNHALARYVTAYTTIQLLDGTENYNNWPITMLYSIYYEFSKRYPHGKSTAIKQDSASTKTEMIFRMLNYTLGEATFKRAMRRFMADRQYKTFFGDDIWSTYTDQAREDGVLDNSMSINEIAASWITKDRLPVINVTRNYGNNSVTITQRVYLRERPHDVPDQEKFLWWIPIVLIPQTSLDFTNWKPLTWMRKERSITIDGMPDDQNFIIVNPEEIGPFPVLYDTRNWDMLAGFLQIDEHRKKIPVNTRAKLLHDAWNLAYAGDLRFNIALNMTLFLKYETNYIAWDPVFTMIDHIGRHIDSSEVHKQFQTYVRLLLSPLYRELGNEPKEGEAEGTAHLRSSSKVFLCQAGYKPCIKEAQAAFRKWMESDNPDEGNPVANQYICPVFKWGTKEEWEFGLQRIIKFPPTRKANERTYLLKTLAGCPIDSWKIEKLLNITVLEENGNFTDNDVYLIFSMLTGGASGYTELFHFLEKNWDAIKVRFEKKAHLWNSLITSATTVFKTQEGLDMVTRLYEEKKDDFGTADFVIERALKNIKEETKWSNENLPMIEKWLDWYLATNKDT